MKPSIRNFHWICFQSYLLIVASEGTDKRKDYQSEASHMISEDNELEHHYHQYIQEQTNFGDIIEAQTSQVFTTVPPRLTIVPSQVEKNEIFKTIRDISSMEYENVALNHCDKSEPCNKHISATEAFHSESTQVLRPSLATKEDVVVIAGRMETQSRTEILNDVFGTEDLQSEPSTKLVLNTS